MTVRRFSWPADALVLTFLVGTIYGLILFARAWGVDFEDPPPLDLSVWRLPYYALLSGIRGGVAYLLSLFFTLGIGYWAAHSPRAERFLIPLVDVLQSVPVLGFLPGLVYGLVALFPKSHVGLELAALLLIFTGQVWNLLLSYYSSLKSIPDAYHEVAQLMGLSAFQKWLKIELPFSALPLVWNSLLSMAGGWFFLIPCEALTLGTQTFLLEGMGSYMFVAMKEGNPVAMGSGLLAMACLILLLDFLIWKPLLVWSQRFRSDPLQEEEGGKNEGPESLMQLWIRRSVLLTAFSTFFREFFYFRKRRRRYRSSLFPERVVHPRSKSVVFGLRKGWWRLPVRLKPQPRAWLMAVKFFGSFLLGIFGLGAIWIFFELGKVLLNVSWKEWSLIFQHAFWSLLRVLGVVLLSTLWTLPVGLWITSTRKRVRLCQPILQLLASFPAPMLYPLLLGFFFFFGLSFHLACLVLMLFAVQWYLLFNVLAGGLQISQDLKAVLHLTHVSIWQRWRFLYLPSLLPSLAAGWMTAVGAAWNATVVCEYLLFEGRVLFVPGLGSDLSLALANQNMPLFMASLTVMIFLVVFLNRFCWVRFLQWVQTRFRVEV